MPAPARWGTGALGGQLELTPHGSGCKLLGEPQGRGAEGFPTSPAPCWGLDVAEPGAVARCPFVRPGERLWEPGAMGGWQGAAPLSLQPVSLPQAR